MKKWTMAISVAVTAALLFCLGNNVLAQQKSTSKKSTSNKSTSTSGANSTTQKYAFQTGTDGYRVYPAGACEGKWTHRPTRREGTDSTKNQGTTFNTTGFYAYEPLRSYGVPSVYKRVEVGQVIALKNDITRGRENSQIDPDVADKYDTTLLTYAAWGRRNDLTAVLNAVLDVINTAARNARGKNPCLRLRNDPKRYVNFPDYYGRTALWYAVDRNHENVVGILLKNNAEVDWEKIPQDLKIQIMKNKEDHLTAPNGATLREVDVNGAKMLAFDKRPGYGITILMAGARRGNPNVVAALLAENPNILATDDAGRTALAYAIEERYATVLDQMLSYCSDIGKLDKCFSTLGKGNNTLVLQAVEKLLHPDRISELDVREAKEESIDIESKKTEKERAAREARSLEVLKKILDRKPQDIFKKDIKDNLSVFDKLIDGKKAEALAYALQNGCFDQGRCINYRDDQGNTLLMRAVQKADINTVNAILSVPVDVLAVNRQGISALHMAAADGKLDMLHTMLCKCGGSQCLQKSAVQGRTLKDELIGMAQSRGRQNVVAFLQNPNIVCPPPAAKVRR